MKLPIHTVSQGITEVISLTSGSVFYRTIAKPHEKRVKGVSVPLIEAIYMNHSAKF